MKTIKLFISALFVLAIALKAGAQTHDHSKMNMNQVNVKTESFKVLGNCDMCKARIEKAVKEEGATKASWDSKTQILTVSFDPSKTNKDALSKKVASVGHDTEKYKAPDDVYARLPACCHYDRNK